MYRRTYFKLIMIIALIVMYPFLVLANPICIGDWTGSHYIKFTVSSQTKIKQFKIGFAGDTERQYFYDVTIQNKRFSMSRPISSEIMLSISGTFSNDGNHCSGTYKYGSDSGSWTATPDNPCVTLNNNVGAYMFILPKVVTVGQRVIVGVGVKNYGSESQSNFSVSYSVNNGPPVTEFYTATLSPGERALKNFDTPWIPEITGEYSFSAWTELVNDEDTSNDSIPTPVKVIVQEKVEMQQDWVWQNPLPQGNHLRDIFVFNANMAIAVGHAGTILKTTDGGVTWFPLSSGTTEDLYSVYFTDPDTGWAGGVNGTVLKTNDGGITWNPQISRTTYSLESIFFVNTKIGWAASDWGYLIRTSDGGITWNPGVIGSSYFWQSIYFSGPDTGWVVGGDGLGLTNGIIYKTVDGGNYWRQQKYTASGGLQSVYFIDAKTGWAVGKNGTILKTTNGGTIWKSQASGISANLKHVYFTNADTGWVVGYQQAGFMSHIGIILYTTDGGTSWNLKDIESPHPLYSVKFADNSAGWVVGQGGIILNTINGGNSWDFQTKAIFKDLNSVYFIDANTGWAVGEDGIIAKTMDGGATWDRFDYETLENLYSVYFTDTDTGWAVGGWGIILKTTDGGSSWRSIKSEIYTLFKSVCFINSDVGWIAGGAGTILKTTDGGDNWTPQTSNTQQYLEAVFFLNANNGWAVGSSGAIVKTSDGGITWETQNAETNSTLYSVYFINEDTGWAVGGNTILKTDNGGTDWKQLESGFDVFLYSIHFIDVNFGWAIGSDGIILFTKNGGNSWSSQSSGTSNPLKSIYFPEGHKGWVVGEYGSILKYIGTPVLNDPPVVKNPIPDTTLIVGEDDFSRDLDAAPVVFKDADGDKLSYAANSSDSTIAKAHVTGTILNVKPLAKGMVTVTVTADDGRGGQVSTDFKVQVKIKEPNIVVTPDTLFFHIGVKEKNFIYNSIGNQAILTRSEGEEIQRATFSANSAKYLTGCMKTVNSPWDTLGNLYELPFYYLEGEWQTKFEATKLFPSRRCTLKALRYAFYNYDDSEKSKECELYIWDDQNGRPGNTIWSATKTITMQPKSWDWVEFNISNDSLILTSFWMGHREKTEGSPTSLLDTLCIPKTNFFSFDDTTWIESSHDYLHQAIVSYGPSEDEDVAVLTLRNAGNASLNVQDISSAELWITDISIKIFDLEPDEERKVKLRCNAAGMNDGLYVGTLKIKSNDPDTPVSNVVLVMEVCKEVTENVVNEIEPNNKSDEAQQLRPPSPVVVLGNAAVSDDGVIFGPSWDDDIEDLFMITTKSTGIRLTLTEFSSDLDLFLMKIEGNSTTFYGTNHRGSAQNEEFNKSDLEPGTYFIGVSIYDPKPIGPNSCSYKLTIIGDIILSVEETNLEIPTQFVLKQNYPNPFNTATIINYQLPKSGSASLLIYDILGREVISFNNKYQIGGNYHIVWDGRDSFGKKVPSGIYFYKIVTKDFLDLKKMIITK